MSATVEELEHYAKIGNRDAAAALGRLAVEREDVLKRRRELARRMKGGGHDELLGTFNRLGKSIGVLKGARDNEQAWEQSQAESPPPAPVVVTPEEREAEVARIEAAKNDLVTTRAARLEARTTAQAIIDALLPALEVLRDVAHDEEVAANALGKQGTVMRFTRAEFQSLFQQILNHFVDAPDVRRALTPLAVGGAANFNDLP